MPLKKSQWKFKTPDSLPGCGNKHTGGAEATAVSFKRGYLAVCLAAGTWGHPARSTTRGQVGGSSTGDASFVPEPEFGPRDAGTCPRVPQVGRH